MSRAAWFLFEVKLVLVALLVWAVLGLPVWAWDWLAGKTEERIL